MEHEVLEDDTTLDECLDVELLLEDGLDQADALGSSESLVLCSSGIFKWDVLELVLELDEKFLVFCCLVQNVVAEVDTDNHLLVGFKRVFECLGLDVHVVFRTALIQ